MDNQLLKLKLNFQILNNDTAFCLNILLNFWEHLWSPEQWLGRTALMKASWIHLSVMQAYVLFTPFLHDLMKVISSLPLVA